MQDINELKITEAEKARLLIKNANNRPNAMATYGQAKKSSSDVKDMFDQQFEFIAGRFNKFCEAKSEEQSEIIVAEQSRVAAEKNREAAEALRVEAEDKRETAAKEATKRANDISQTLENKLENGEFKGPQGIQGPQGEQGIQGPKGDAGVIEFIAGLELPTENIKNAIYLVPSTTADSDSAFDEYIYTLGAWEKIGSASVAVNLDEYVKFTDYATKNKAGVVLVSTSGHPNDCYGVMMSSINKNLVIRRATNDIIAARIPSDYIDAEQTKADRTMPICPANLDYAVVQVLTNYKGDALTDEEKATACDWLGAVKRVDEPNEHWNQVYAVNSKGEQVMLIAGAGQGANKLMISDAYGNINVSEPRATNNAATKKYVDDAIGDISSALDELHTYAQSLAGGDTE